MIEWLCFLLGVLLLMWKVWLICFCRFHFLKVTKDVESYLSSLSSYVYPHWPFSLVDVGGGWFQSGIRAGCALFRS